MSCPCGKNDRQRLYCRRPDCSTMVAVDLPPPTVDVTSAPEHDPSAPPGSVDVFVHRGGKGRSFRAVGMTPIDLVQDAVEKVLGAHPSTEWIPRG